PLHAGHLHMAEAAGRLAQAPVAFELSVENVDKPTLSTEELHRRLRQFAWRAPVWLTRAPTFLQKTRPLPGAVFVVGVDTAERLVAREYHGGSEARVREALDAIRSCGCRFLVAGRADKDGTFRCLEHVAVPEGHGDLFAAIPEADFRLDIS